MLGRETATLREIVTILRETYCGPIGVEFMHIQDPDQKSWIQRRVEGAPWRTAFDARRQSARILQQLTEAEGFEAFCQKRYVTTKRFGLEGGEVTIPALHAIIETVAAAGVNEIAIGMPHRGRLNTLVNIVKKPLTAVFSRVRRRQLQARRRAGLGRREIPSRHLDRSWRSPGTACICRCSRIRRIWRRSIRWWSARCARGRTQAGDTQRRSSVMAILMHGDAAFAGQGLVYETLAMSQLIGYRTGGTVHLIVNNQIGFTTVPAHAYSGLYCTDVAKSIQAPILHVNGDDPEAVMFCARMAAEFRMRFATDIVLDIVCYRRHGHNETDEPAFTQPLMYRAIGQTEDHAHAVCRAAGGGRRGAGRRKRRRCGTSSAPRWKRPTRRRRPTSRTRPTGWRAIGPVSTPPTTRFERQEEATAVPEADAEADRHARCRACPPASTCIRASPASSRPSRR